MDESSWSYLQEPSLPMNDLMSCAWILVLRPRGIPRREGQVGGTFLRAFVMRISYVRYFIVVIVTSNSVIDT